MGISIRDVTVIVPTRGRKARVGNFLDQLQHPHDLTIIVVDEGRESEDLPGNLNGQVIIKVAPACGPVKAVEKGIESSKTSHVLVLGDDLTLEPGCIEEAVAYYNANFDGKEAVVGLNQQVERDSDLACFALMSKRFYMDICHPVPYRRFYQDTEWTAKAKMLGLYGVAEKARINHPWEPHDRQQMEAELPLFTERMARFQVALCPKANIFIGVPVFGSVDVHFFDSMMKFVQNKSESMICKIAVVAGDSLVPRARNTLTMEFLKASDCTHLLFIDSDLIFSAEHVARLVSHDVDIVGGFYPKKQQGDPELVFNTLDTPAPMDERRLTPVKYIGTGFIMVKRCVFEKMISEYGDEMIFKVDGPPDKFGFDFWPVGVYKYKDGTRRYLSEDWYFCQRARDLGFTIYGDNGVILKHSGSAVYPLKSQEAKLFGRLPSNAAVPAAAAPESPLCEAAAITT
jgi:hypothetical protein